MSYVNIDSGPVNQACDRVFLRDHIAEYEVGINADEYGVKQRLRFTVELDVRRYRPDFGDDVENVVSYDMIIDAIREFGEGPQINLLETLGEMLADRLLSERRVFRAQIRIEKLDRVSGALGIEIERRALE